MQTCVAALFLTWLTSGSYHWFMVLGSPNQGFHFNANGLMMCEPYSTSSGLLIASSYLFYFPTTMVLMYCYGTVFHSSKVKAKYRIAMLSTISGAAEALKQKAKKVPDDSFVPFCVLFGQFPKSQSHYLDPEMTCFNTKESFLT